METTFQKETKFPKEVKFSDITSIHTKNNWHDKENYQTISILLASSEIFEWCHYDKIYKNVKIIFSKYELSKSL